MVQCEMCGVETPAPKTAKIEGAELQVCGDCVEFGTEIRSQASENATTKYSTTGSPRGTDSSGQPARSQQTGSSRRRRDMFDEMEEIVSDYHARIRDARESDGLTQAELADQLNEKASLIRKLERGDHLPSDAVRKKLERALSIELLESSGVDEEPDSWSGGGEASGMTLGDIVKRRD